MNRSELFGVKIFLVALEVVGDPLVVGGHGGVTFLPIHGANFAVLLKVLESIDDAEAFLDGAAEGHVIHDLVADGALEIDEEEATVSNEFTFDRDITIFIDDLLTCEDVVSFRDRLVNISNERVVDAMNAALVFGSIDPSPVREFGVGGATHDGHITGFELSHFLLEAVEFGRADEGEVLRVEEENDVFFADELIERE